MPSYTLTVGDAQLVLPAAGGLAVIIDRLLHCLLCFIHTGGECSTARSSASIQEHIRVVMDLINWKEAKKCTVSEYMNSCMGEIVYSFTVFQRNGLMVQSNIANCYPLKKWPLSITEIAFKNKVTYNHPCFVLVFTSSARHKIHFQKISWSFSLGPLCDGSLWLS